MTAHNPWNDVHCIFVTGPSRFLQSVSTRAAVKKLLCESLRKVRWENKLNGVRFLAAVAEGGGRVGCVVKY